MQARSLSSLTRAAVLGAACLGATGLGAACTSAPPVPGKSPPAHPSSAPARSSETSEAAAQLARRVAWQSGYDQLDRVQQLDFRFVVLERDERRFEAEHRWDLARGKIHITWLDRDGRALDAILDLHTRTAEGTIEGQVAEGPAAKFLAEKAYQRYINDTYWLMMPVKLLDPGTRLELEEPREHRGKKHEVLRLSFEGVGLTPGDVYWLFVDPDAHRIVRWEMKLQGQEGPPVGYSWEEYRPVGPLLLAHEHRSDDGVRNIVIEDARASREVRADDFTLPRR